MKENNYSNQGKKKTEGVRNFSSDALENSISNITNPRFLGSIHMNRKFVSNFTSVENLLNNELEMKMDKSLKSTLFNPITKVLILSMIIFNLVWLLFLFVI
ncbi:MAG: hypothetical protein ACFFAO_12790 [Candidatus Hermodarchaeota archaeon]